MDMNEVIANEMTRVDDQRDRLLNHPKIAPFIRSVGKWISKTQDRDMTIYEKRNVAQCLMNCIMDAGAKQSMPMFEATGQGNIAFLGVQLPVIAALLPTLVLNEVANVQAIDRRIAAVFYLNVLHGSAKGQATSGGSMISAQTGHAVGQSERRYAMARVSRENLGTGNGALSGTTSTAPGLINLQNVIVETLTGSTYAQIGTCTSAGVISGSGISGNGSINAAGVYSFTVTGVSSVATVLFTYDYQYDLPVDSDNERDGVPEMNIEVTQSAVEAIDFPLRAIWSLGAQIDLQKAHGLNLENELVTYLGGEIRFAIDQYGLDLIDNAAEGGWDPIDQVNFDPATQVSDWDARPSEGEPWLWKKSEFIDRIEQGSNAIFEKTKRGVATFMVCGNDVARVVKQLGKEYFTPASGLGKQIPTGPIKLGTLNNQVTVIQNPFKTSTRYTLGFRGPDYLHAGFIYAPYIPLFSTPTLTTSDLVSQKGFLSSAAFKTINAGLFTYGDITNLMGGYVVGS